MGHLMNPEVDLTFNNDRVLHNFIHTEKFFFLLQEANTESFVLCQLSVLTYIKQFFNCVQLRRCMVISTICLTITNYIFLSTKLYIVS
jgi:hypothetical protein